jgi:aerobic C4-dicarboxylate transport protein
VNLIRQLWFQVVVATVVGVLLGHFAPSLGEEMKPFGDAFIALVKMIIPPVVFCTVVHGVATMSDASRVGRVAGKALAYFMAMTAFALLFALVAVNLWRPGDGMNVDPAAIDTGPIAGYAELAHEQGLAPFLLGIIPTTFASAFTQSNVLQVLFVSLLFAFALGAVGEAGKPVLAFIEALSGVFFKIVGFIMWAAPLGAFGAIAYTVAAFGVSSLVSLGELIVEFYTVSAVFVAVVFGVVAWAVGVNLWRLLGYLREEIVVVAATTSTETVLPRLMEKLEKLGCEKSVVGLVVPTGYSFNLDGTCLYLATASVFLAQATNTHLPLGDQLALMAVLLITSKGAAGVPGAAFVVLAATLGTVGTIPLASIALILGIHRLMAEALTFVNLIGNALATLVVCRWEGAVDLATLQERVGFRRGAPARSPIAPQATEETIR